MATPILYLCAHASDGVTGERIVATEFDTWLCHYDAHASGGGANTC